MSDEDYKDMILQHDKHIDKLALSIEHIAGAVGSTNKKLEDIIDVISKQNLLMEKFSNMEANLKESFGRVHDKIRAIEEIQNKTGCSFVIAVNDKVKKLEANQNRVVRTILTIVIGSVMGLILIKGN